MWQIPQTHALNLSVKIGNRDRRQFSLIIHSVRNIVRSFTLETNGKETHEATGCWRDLFL
jgi:hypothetical protein